MDQSLITALLTFLTALVPVLGALVGLLINRSRLNAEDKALALALTSSVTNAVKSVSQTVTENHRDHRGHLPEELREAAKKEALKLTKTLLGDEKLQAARKKYGVNGEVEQVLSTLAEAVLHDVKNTRVTTSTAVAAATTTPQGEATTTTTQTTTATNAQAAPALVVSRQ